MDKKVFRILKCLVHTREPINRNQAILPFSIMGKRTKAQRSASARKGARTRKAKASKKKRKRR